MPSIWKLFPVTVVPALLFGVLVGCDLPAVVPAVGDIEGRGTVEVELAPADATQATLTAVPTAGWCFDHWEDAGENESTENPRQVATDLVAELTAFFEEGPTAEGEGTIEVDPALPTNDTIVALTATADDGWRFDRWEGPDDVSSENPHNVRTTRVGCYVAWFLEQVTLTLTTTGRGTVQIDEEDITEPLTLDVGARETVTAVAALGWRFARWEGDLPEEYGSEDDLNPLILPVEQDINLEAVFLEQVALTVAVEGEGSVEVEGIDEVGTAPVQVDTGVEQVLTAVPADGWRFDHWGGDVDETDNPLTLTIDEDVTITAEFVETFTLTVRILDEDGEEFFSDEDPESDTFTGSGVYDPGTEVEIAASVPDGWEFDRWISEDFNTDGVDDVADAETTVTVERDLTLTGIAIDRSRTYQLDIVIGNGAEGIPFVAGATSVTLASSLAEFDASLAYSPGGYFLACWSDLDDPPASGQAAYGGIAVRDTFYHGEAVILGTCSYVIETGSSTFTGETTVGSWGGDADSSGATVTVIMDDDKTVTVLP